MKKIVALVALLGSLALFTACTPRMAGHLVAGAIVGAAVAGAVHHAHHFHHHNCGCPRHWDGRWVYYYQGGYEYYDPHARVWYRY